MATTKMVLHTTLIWHDEVMADVTLTTPRSVTLGSTGKPTFVVPDVGLPDNFAIIRPGNRGFLLTLGEQMRGTICIDGVDQDIATLVRGGFHATAINAKDWGLIELDATGSLKLFFNFIPHDETQIATSAKSLLRPDEDSMASLAFSVALHTSILLLTYRVYAAESLAIWPSSNSLTGNYLVARLDSEPPPETPSSAPTVGTAAGGEGQDAGSGAPTPVPTVGDALPSGEEPTPRGPQRAPSVGLMSAPNRRRIDQIVNRGLTMDLDIFAGMPGGPTLGFGVDPSSGIGGTKPGTGGGPGGPGRPRGVGPKGPPGPLKIGPIRDAPPGRGVEMKQIELELPPPTGDFDGLTRNEIEPVVRAGAGRYRACYQRQVNLDPSLSGTMVVTFVIDSTGTVTSTRTSKSTLRSADVEQCVKSQFMRLKFNAKPGGAIVNYPLVFSHDG